MNEGQVQMKDTEEFRSIRGKLWAVLDKWSHDTWAAYVDGECYPKGRKVSDAARDRLSKIWFRFIWDSFYVIEADLAGPEALKGYLDSITR